MPLPVPSDSQNADHNNSDNKNAARQSTWLVLALGLLLVLPSLWLGLQLDDYFHWGLVSQSNPVLQTLSPASPYGLFSFVDGDPNRVMDLVNLGLLPWWTYPEVEYAFWRPMTELSHGLDYSLWPQQPWLMHVQSLFYYGLMLWFGSHLFRRLQGKSSAWLWASFLFALSYSHGVPVGWLANRNAVLAVLFVILTLSAHHRWRQQAQRNLLGLRALLWFVAGLLCGEMAVTAGAYLLAYALLLERGPLRDRLFALLPYVMVGCAWLGLRGLLGYGAAGSGHYIDPLHTPLLFLQTLSSRGLDLLGGLFWVVPPELDAVLPVYRHPLVVVLSGLLLWLAWPLLRRDRRARFWLLGSLLCLVPVASTIPHSRLLIAASIGAAGFLGLLMQQWRAGVLVAGGRRQQVARVLVPLLIVLQLGLSAVLLPLESLSMKLVGETMVNQGARSWDLRDLPAGATPVLINPPLSSAGGYINGVRAYLGLPVAARSWLLASGERPLVLTVVDANTLELTSKKGLYDAVHEGVLRGPQAPLVAGDRVQLAGMQVTVLTARDGVPLQARYQFNHPLLSEHYRFYLWHEGNIVQCQLPAVGVSINLRSASAQCAAP